MNTAAAGGDRRPVGARYSVTSRDLRILMGQPTEPIPSYDTPTRHEDHGFARPKRRRLPQRAMRTVAVVVIGILTHHRHQVPTSKMSIRSKHSRRTVATHRSA
jgi:hypothetical protein